MRIRTSAAAFLAICICAPTAFAAEPQPAQPACIDPKQSPDYVPGVDARGKQVPPADIPADGNIEIGTQVYAEVKTGNPQVPRVGVEVNLNGLKQLPPCPPAPKRAITNSRR